MSALTVSSENTYNFSSRENAAKWKGVFTAALKKVQEQVHPSLRSREDALEYIESLILQLLGLLCNSKPHTVQDVAACVENTFPHPIDKWAIRDAQIDLDRGRKNSNIVLPVDKIHPSPLKDVLGYKVDYQVAQYIVAVLEYIAADVLKLTGNYVKIIKHVEITYQDIKVAMNADKVLMNMFLQDDDLSLYDDPEPAAPDSMTYEDIVKDFILEETQYMRDLNMIITVFRKPFATLFPRSKDLEVIFSNILEVYELTANLLSSVEERLEIVEENNCFTVGICFEETALAEEFSVYEYYTADAINPRGRERLNILLQRDDMKSVIQSRGHGFKEAVKYLLPKLLLGPIYHCLHYYEVVKLLRDTSPSDDDNMCLNEAVHNLHSLKGTIESKYSGILPKKRPWETSLRLHDRTGRVATRQKMTELQNSIDGWDGKDIWQSCSEIIKEGILLKQTGRRLTERHVFLFDGLLILCKQNMRRTSVTGALTDYKLKEKFYIRKIEVLDKEDCEDCKHAFELQVKEHPNIMLVAKSSEEKSNWMACLIALQTRSMLDRTLDSMLKEEDRHNPLRLPSPDQYVFAIEDTSENIVFEDKQDSSQESPLIRGGTINKLVERLTYHMYADLKFVRIFLTTYRTFCFPHDLLDLLILRYDIPEPQDSDLRRFKKEYCKPIQFRVLNVLRHWVDNHIYDFEHDCLLLEKLNNFLKKIKGKAMLRMTESVQQLIQRRMDRPSGEREFMFDKQAPRIEWHLTQNPEQFELLTLHPLEIARQITLLEFDLYRAVKPSELVGSVWTKKEKFKTSPNLLKMTHHSTAFTFWLEKCIIEAENLEERVAVVCRIIEIIMVFQELNNFNGVLEVVSALSSAPVHRLDHTFADVPARLMRVLTEAKQLLVDHFRKYIERLRSINPPCVPFLGMYLTNIVQTEQGNPDFLRNKIINFSKRRKVAEITGEIQQYQNQPYYLAVEPAIKKFFESLNPLQDKDRTEKDFNDYLYNKSQEIEPRNCKQAPKFPRTSEYSLKSPGIKPSANRHSRNTPSMTSIAGGGYQRMTDEDEVSSPPCSTPPTPSTPHFMTPPATGETLSDTSVFSAVYLGREGAKEPMHAAALSEPAGASAPLVPIVLDDPPAASLKPPIIPPRRPRREHSPSRTAPIMSMRSDMPPPVPPRRETLHNSMHMRGHSMSISHPPSYGGAAFVAVTRRFSERDWPSSSCVNVNGEDIPEVPPRTYASFRKQSS